MSSGLDIGLALALGAMVGLVYCAILWRSLISLLGARQPGVHVLFSAIARVALAVLALFLIGGGEWQTLVAGLAGFTVARSMVSRRMSRALSDPVRASRS